MYSKMRGHNGFLSVVAVAILTVCVGFASEALTVAVADFGAVGDGVTDDTAAFQQALDAVGAVGGTVTVASGRFRIKGTLRVPADVCLEGTWHAPPRDVNSPGSVLLASAGKGDEAGEPFIRMHQDSALKGIKIFYPEQDIVDGKAIPYPWTVRGSGDNIAILDVLIVNPYQGVDFGTVPCGRHYINRLYMQPLYRGLFIDKCYDVGRIENVHLWPFWRGDEKTMNYTKQEGIAFIFGRTDWQFVTNCFCIAYNVGFLFTEVKDGPGNVLVTQSGSDIGPCAVRVETVQTHAGVSFSNCQFMAGIEVLDTNTGPVKFTSCGFWPVESTTSHATLAGLGHIFFEGCHFSNWDMADQGAACIDADAGGLTVTGCDFMAPLKTQVRLGENVQAAIIAMNRFRGGLQLENSSRGDVQVGLNTGTSGLHALHDAPSDAVVYLPRGENIERSTGWIPYTCPSTFYGLGLWAVKGDGKEYFTWCFRDVRAKKYEILVWIPDDSGKSHATDALYTVHHAKGVTEVVIDQNNDVTRWKSLGVYKLNKKSRVTVTNRGDGNVVVDSVAIVPSRTGE